MPQARDPGPAESPDSLHAELGGRRVSIQIRREGRVLSPHTGRELRELHGWIATPDPELHERLSGALRALSGGAIRAGEDSGDLAGRWLVSWNSYAEAGGVHTYTLILREEEELSLEALHLDDLELHPYEYRERMVGEGLAIWAKLVGAEEELERVRERVRGRGAFPVVRRGIQDEPREMRLGVAEWSPFEEGVKYRLVMVDAGITEEMRLELARIEEENSRAALGYYENFVERLADLLVERGLVSPAEMKALREDARASPGAGRREFWRVADVDALP